MFAYCNNNPANGDDSTGHSMDWTREAYSFGTSGAGSCCGGGDIAVTFWILATIYALLTSSSDDCSTTVDGVSSASVKALDNTVHQNQLSDIASKYGLYKCKEAAIAMCKQDRGRSIIQLKFAGGTFVVADEGRFGNAAISKNGVHYGYKDTEGFVHCNVYPFGLPQEVWVNSFHDQTGLPPIVTEIPIIIP